MVYRDERPALLARREALVRELAMLDRRLSIRGRPTRPWVGWMFVTFALLLTWAGCEAARPAWRANVVR